MAEEFETRVPSASTWTVNTLNTDSQANADLFKDLENLSTLPEITTLEELLAYVQENIIRFDTAPKNYKKDDYKSLLKMINRAMFYIYRRDPEITKILNGVYYIGAATTSTDPAADKTARGYNHVGIYTANQAGTYINFGITVTENEANQNITFLVPVFDGITYGTSYTKVVYALPHMATLQGDRLFDKISFNVSNPVPTLLAGQAAWNTDEGTLVVGMNGGDVEQSVGFELYLRIKASVNITNGQLLMHDGTDGNSGVIKAKPAEPGCDPKLIIGIATENVSINQLGIVTWFGKIRGLNTSAFLPNDELFQSTTTSGALQKTMPAAPNNKSKYAVVINSHATVGTIFVRMQRSQSLNDINDVDTTDSQSGQPLVKQSDGVWKGSYSTTINEIQPAGGTLSVPDATINAKTVEAADANLGTVIVDTEITAPGYKVESKTDDDFIMANGGTLPITTLKADIYQLYNPSNNTQVVLEINAAGQVLVNGDIIQNGSAYKIDAEEVTTKEQIITLRSDATTGMPINDLAGFIIKLYDGVNDGMIVIDNTGTLRIGDVGDLQPVMTREESPVDQSPLFFNTTTKRAETLPGTTTKSSLADLDAVMVKDSADSYKPKWWTFANIKANLKSYFDTLFVQLANVNQTIQGVKTFSSLPKIPLAPIANEDAASKAYADGVGNTTMIAANAARDKAQQWAENPEDTEVEAGKYSALHWAAKAAASAAGIADSAEMLVKHEAEIASLENVINSANINQETTATATGVDTVVLPKTAANTGMQVQLFGQSAEQLVANGNFESNYPTPWAGTTPTLVSDVFRAGSKSGYFNVSGDISYFRKDIVCSATDKLYITSSYRLKSYTSGSAPAIRISDFGGFTNINQLNSLTTSVVDTWYDYSYVVNGRTGGIRYTIGYFSSAIVQFYVDNIKIINLTATFGAGNEPTKEQCDLLFANYFEGSKNVFGTGRVRSVGKNLFDKYNYFDGEAILVSNGASATNASYFRTNYIAVKPNTQYIQNYGTTGSGANGIAFYDANKVLISTSILSGVKPTFTTPSGTRYIRTSVLKSQGTADLFQIEQGATATTYEPYRQSILQLTTPELRSNGLIKDEIRKGTNGYELVKKVGVGTLGAELIPQPVNFTTGWTRDNASLVTIDSSTQFTTTGVAGLIRSGGLPGGNKFVRVKIKGSISTGTLRIRGSISNTNAVILTGTFDTFFYVNWDTQTGFYLLALNAATVIIQELSIKEVIPVEAILNPSTLTEIGGLPYYTLATPAVTPIPHAGLLNSNSNGTAYFEPIIADAGVYASNIAIQLTDYPISSFESIRKYANGAYTELNIATAVIASGGLSFTHPDLVSGDLVMFTYAYNRESIGRSMIFTYPISNSNPYYNVTNSVPLTSGYYTSTTARAAVPEGVRKTGLILTYETAAGVWYTERYIGTATDTTSFTNAANWEVGVLRIASVTDTTEYAEITI